jgi:hypothetical protein
MLGEIDITGKIFSDYADGSCSFTRIDLNFQQISTTPIRYQIRKNKSWKIIYRPIPSTLLESRLL